VRALIVLTLSFALLGPTPEPVHAQKSRVLIVVVDGLRPDYITPERMPRLNALADGGVRGLAHHAVYPTVTRVNGPSIFTGRHPGGHGLLGNSVYLPEVDASRVLNAGDAADLQVIDDATNGGLLTAPSLAELLERGGRTFFAASSGGSGSGMLMNHRGASVGLVHNTFTLPDSLGPVVEDVLGPLPEPIPGSGSVALVGRAVDAILRIGVDRADADVLAVWLTEPDGTAHRTGMGSPETVRVLAAVDAHIGRLLDGLEERGALANTDILVTSDHGFARRVGTESLSALLVRGGLKASASSLDVVVAGDAIHVREGGEARQREIVRLLQTTDWVGPIFTRGGAPGSSQGHIPGTLAFSTIGWDHARSADILVSADGSDALNPWGFPGAVRSPGVAGHGSANPWVLRATFAAAGPRMKRGQVSRVPTGNIDLVPTVLHLAGLPIPEDLDGRVLSEVFEDGPALTVVKVESDPISATATVDGVRYSVRVDRSRVGGTTYLDGASVLRDRGPATNGPELAEDAIRSIRAASNAAIAAHDPAGVRRTVFDDLVVTASGGDVFVGGDEMMDRFAGAFEDPEFVTYVREPDVVEVDSTGLFGAERGRWVGSWQKPDGIMEVHGTYMAQWQLRDGRWGIRSELFVARSCRGSRACDSR